MWPKLVKFFQLSMLLDAANFSMVFHTLYLTIILRNRAEYRLILSRRRRLKSDDFREIEQDNCFIIQQIDNKTA